MLPPALPDKDADHLKLLAIFHYILAGTSLLWLGFLALHYWAMSSFLGNPEIWTSAKGGAPPPKEILTIMAVAYLVGAVFIVGGAVLNLVVARFLKRRRSRIFCLVVSGLNCLQMPLGTVLGIFTIIVLGRESVKQKFLP